MQPTEQSTCFMTCKLGFCGRDRSGLLRNPQIRIRSKTTDPDPEQNQPIPMWSLIARSGSMRNPNQQICIRTANEGTLRIQYKCLVPIYVFPEMKLCSLLISKIEL
jgi:hypothetical protein